jgi:hypothetical protein
MGGTSHGKRDGTRIKWLHENAKAGEETSNLLLRTIQVVRTNMKRYQRNGIGCKGCKGSKRDVVEEMDKIPRLLGALYPRHELRVFGHGNHVK